MLPLHQSPKMGRDGVEPPESLTADLQSAPLPLTVYLPKKVKVFFGLIDVFSHIRLGENQKA